MIFATRESFRGIDMKAGYLIRFTFAFVSALLAGSSPSLRADSDGPRGTRITGRSKTHVHADVSEVRIEDFAELGKIHALHTLYFKGRGATDEKFRALAQLRFTNITCVVFTDCHLVTDEGIKQLSRIATLEQMGLRQMSITDTACETMATKMRLLGVNMPNCTNVTVKGLLKLARSELMESLGFSAGNMSQEDLIRLITTAGPQLGRMDIDMDSADETRLDFPALRQAAKAKKMRLFAVRKRSVKEL